jgi:hypothetical protein
LLNTLFIQGYLKLCFFPIGIEVADPYIRAIEAALLLDEANDL